MREVLTISFLDVRYEVDSVYLGRKRPMAGMRINIEHDATPMTEKHF